MPTDQYLLPIRQYIIGIRDWKVAHAIISYLQVNDSFNVAFEIYIKQGSISLEEMRSFENVLADVRSDLGIIFRQLVDPKTRKFENVAKFTPHDEEMYFIMNVELLFHKVIIAKGHKHSMEYYAEKSNGYAESKESFSTILVKIKSLFDEGLLRVKGMLNFYKENVVLISWFLEHRESVAVIFGESVEKLLTDFFGFKDVAEVYRKVGEHFLVNGWGDRARKILEKGAELKQPHSSAALREPSSVLEKF